jgi:hypothetical protein
MKILRFLLVLGFCPILSQFVLAADDAPCCHQPNRASLAAGQKKDADKCKDTDSCCEMSKDKNANGEFRKTVREEVRKGTETVVYSSRGGAVRSTTVHVNQ